MLKDIKNIYVIKKAADQRAATLAEDISSWLAERGIRATVLEHHQGKGEFPCGVQACDLVLVLGGDGTMLSVAREVQGNSPMLGLNLGHVGFLAELSVDVWKPFLQELLANRMRVRETLTLTYELVRDDKVEASGLVINDVVINRGCLARLIRLDVSVDGENIGEIRADGLIISTPTGSTGYCASAGGPVLSPELDAIALTPICPFLDSFKPVVLSPRQSILVEVRQPDAEVCLSLDGQKCLPVQIGDKIRITAVSGGLKLVEPRTSTYFARLRARGVIHSN